MPDRVTARRPFSDPAVAAVFDGYPAATRAVPLHLRDLIFATASATEGVGELVETLKWGQPAYLPRTPKTGTTVRIDALKGRTGAYAMFFHCQTSLIETFRGIYPDAFSFEGNRAIELSVDAAVPEEALRHCISMALTYHRKRARM